VRTIREPLNVIINWPVWLGITCHERCIATAVGLPVSLRVVVPSPTSRSGVHPFAPIAQTMHGVGRAGPVPASMAPCDRVVRADKFRLTPRCEVGGKHVLVLDNVWTTGSDAQSAAFALRRTGAAAVSVMVMDRWLNPRHRTTAEFIDTRLHREYDPDICSVTGGRCP